MGRRIVVFAALVSYPTFSCADPIEGTWKRPNGVIVRFALCGVDFCESPIKTKYAGQPAGKLSADGKGRYVGTLIDLKDNSVYKGKAAIHDQILTLSGCIFGGWICKSEDRMRQ